MSRSMEQSIGRALREREHKPSIFRLGAAASHSPDLVGYINGRRVEVDVAAPAPKTCCNQDCRQGRDCPQRSRKVKAYPEVPAAAEPSEYVSTWRDYLPDLARAMLIVAAFCIGALVASMLVIASRP